MVEFDSSVDCNSVIWLTSLPHEDLGPTRRMVEDMELLRTDSSIGFQYIQIKSPEHLTAILSELTLHAANHGMRPMLHFDMHGDKDKGMLICNEESEYVSWHKLITHLKELNKATHNNLIVVGAACYGLRAITSIKINDPVPFFVLLAPEGEVSLGFVEDNIPAFYRELFHSGELDPAYNKYLSNELKYFHCERMLFLVLLKYIKSSCKGKSARERREYLLTEILSQELERNKDNMKIVRKKIKDGIKPDKSLLDRYVKTFLVGKPCSFNIDQLLDFIEEADK